VAEPNDKARLRGQPGGAFQLGAPSPLTRTFAALLGSQAIARGIRFVYLIMIARVLSSDEVGVYLYGLAFYQGIMVLSIFGQDVFLSTRLGRSAKRAARLTSHSLTLIALTITLGLIAGLAFVQLTEQRPLVAHAANVFLAALVVRSFVVWVRYGGIAREDATWIPRYELIFRGGEALVGTILLLSGAGLLAICYLHFLALAVEAFFALRLMRRRFGITIRFGRDRRLLTRIAGASAVFAVSTGLLQVLSVAGLITLKLMQPDTAIVAQFGIAMQLLTTLLVVPLSFGGALLPALGRVRRSGGDLEVESLATVIKAALVLGGLVAIFAQALAPWFVSLLFGADFEPAGHAFAWLSWALGPYAVVLIVGQALNSLNSPIRAAWLATATVLLNVVLVVAFVQEGALLAASIALCIASFAGCLLGLLFLNGRIGSPGHGWWARPLAAVVVVGLAMQPEVLPSLLTAPILAALLLLCVWWLGLFSRNELDFVLARLGLHR